MGRDKALLKLNGRPLITIVIERLRQVCSDMVIVASNTELYQVTLVPVVQDIFPNVGVLGGLHAGLIAARCDLALVVACDMPFLLPTLLTAFAGWADGFDAVVLRDGDNVEPLHAAYRKTCLPSIERAIYSGKRRVISFFPEVRVRYISPIDAKQYDSRLLSFRNINTPEEWERAQTIWMGYGQAATESP